MDRINVQRWASSLRQCRRQNCQPSIVNDVCAEIHNTSLNDSQKYFIKFDQSPTKNDSNCLLNSESNMTNNNDIDGLSDAETYIIEDDHTETTCNNLSKFKRQTKTRHGTFDIQGLISSASHAINRPIVDANIPILDLSSSTPHVQSGTNETISVNITLPEKVKPPEYFIISSTIETKPFSHTNNYQRRKDALSKEKSFSSEQSGLSSVLLSSNRDKYSTYDSKQDPSNQESHRFQIDQNSIKNKNTNTNEPIGNLTKVYRNKTCSKRQNDTNSLSSMLLDQQNSNRTMNRAVELRRARAQAKIEELSQHTKKQSHKTSHQNDSVSSSCDNSMIKKDFLNFNSNNRLEKRSTNILCQKQDLFQTRTISSENDNKSSMTSDSTNENTDYLHIKQKRCNTLCNNGQRLAIKVIQISSGILEKLKLNDDVNSDEISEEQLQKLVDQLQIINRTLLSIDGTLPNSNNSNI